MEMRFVFILMCLIEIFVPVTRAQNPGAGGDPQPPADEEEDAEYEEEQKEEEVKIKDTFTFVALLDIVFTDGCKRTCTGAIIHDYAVVTAAHCFTMQRDPFLQPELTLSFVVIGTKLMYETGYAQYLPIERVVTHPRFRNGWQADIALVFTFANMIADKPGQVLPMASDKSSAPVDLNVTVFSWGKCKTDEDEKEQDGNSRKVRKHPVTELNVEEEITNSKLRDLPARQQRDVEQSDMSKLGKSSSLYQNASLASDNEQLPRRYKSGQQASNGKAGKRKSRYLGNKQIKQRVHQSEENTETKFKYFLSSKADDAMIMSKNHRRDTDGRRMMRMSDYSHYRSWRRELGSSYNNLTVGIFGYVNLVTCKKLVQKSLPPQYEIKEKNEVLCYASEEFYITNEDSGAPVVQGGELTAVTVGGVATDGEHVAVGMKVTCFCSWILEMVPKVGTTQIKCCKNCCNEDKRGNKKEPAQSLRTRPEVYSMYKQMNSDDKVPHPDRASGTVMPEDDRKSMTNDSILSSIL